MAKSINKDREDPMGDYLGAGGGAGQAPNTVPFDNLAPKLKGGSTSSTVGDTTSDDLVNQLENLNVKMDNMNDQMAILVDTMTKITFIAETIVSDGVIWKFDE